MRQFTVKMGALALSIAFSLAALYNLLRGLRMRAPNRERPRTIGELLVRKDLLTPEGQERLRTAARLYLLGLVSLVTALFI
jgi:hypothetical protein